MCCEASVKTPSFSQESSLSSSKATRLTKTNLYANAEHGFAVRTNLTDKKKAFAQESAYFQAVRWFDAWIKDEI